MCSVVNDPSGWRNRGSSARIANGIRVWCCSTTSYPSAPASRRPYQIALRRPFDQPGQVVVGEHHELGAVHRQIGQGLEERHHVVVRQPWHDDLVLEHTDARPRRDIGAIQSSTKYRLSAAIMTLMDEVRSVM